MSNGPPDSEEPRRGIVVPEEEEKSDLKVVLQFFVVPLVLVGVLVIVFFGLQFLRSRNPDPQATLESLEHYEGFLARVVGDLKRWQYGYDLSLLMRGEDPEGIRKMLPQLVEGFRGAGARGDLKLRRYLALALGSSQDPRAVTALREGLKDEDSQTRLFSAWGLAQMDDPEALPDLRAAVRDEDAGVRKLAVFALGRLGDREGAVLVRSALEDPEADVRWNAALALARLGDRTAVPILMDLLESSVGEAEEDALGGEADRDELAINAIRGLALLKAPEAEGVLRRLAGSAGDSRIAETARLALEAYGSGVP
jgi:HEAT repeat protein